MKKIVWKNGNKMNIETGHKTFDRQTNVISAGNVIANTMTGFYIRPSFETECNGFENPAGHLQNFDLKQFSNLPQFVYQQTRQLVDQNGGGILYCFYHYYKPREYNRYNHRVYDTYPETRYYHGWILTDKNHKKIRSWIMGNSKSYEIICECEKYVCE